MKLGTLKAISHNVADSLGSGIGMLIGVYEMNVFGEAARTSNGSITGDFLAGKAIDVAVSPKLAAAIAKYRAALPELCSKHGASIEEFKELSARYFAHTLEQRMVVRIQDRNGRISEDEYIGTPARRRKVRDRLGRIRTKRPR
jgi:hypothetical protein